MASRNLGSLTLDLIAKTGNFEAGMTRAERASSRATKKIASDAEKAAAQTKAAFGNIARFAAGALAGVSVGAAFKSVIDNTRVMQQEQAQLAAVLKSTGNAAGFTRDELNKMAGSLSGKSIFSTGEINQAQTALLAFTGVMGGEFVRAQQAAADMAARTGMSIQSTVELIGRALDVPSQGMAALSRQGFRFSEDQKKLMEQLEATGETAKAQGIILEALEESYGGAAQAARDTFGGALTGLRNDLADLMTGGEDSLQGATDAINTFNAALTSDESKAAFSAVVSSIATGAGLIVKALVAIPWKEVTAAVGALAAIIATRYVVAVGASGVAMAKATIDATLYQAALARMAGVSTQAAVALTAQAVAARAAGAAMALVGGPAGVAILAASAIAYFATKPSAADKEAQRLAGSVAKLTSNMRELSAAEAPAAIDDMNKEIARLEKELAKSSARAETLNKNLKEFPNSDSAVQWQKDLNAVNAEIYRTQEEINGAKQKVVEFQGAIDRVNTGPMADGVRRDFGNIGDDIKLATALIGDFTAAQRFAIEASMGKHGNDVEQQKYLAGLYAEQDTKRQIFEQSKRSRSAAKSAASQRESAQKATASRAAANAKRAEEEAKRAIEKAQQEAKAIQDVVDMMIIEQNMLGSSAEAVKVAEYARKGADEAQLKRYGEALEAVRAYNDEKTKNVDAQAVIDSLKTEEEQILESYEKRRSMILDSTIATEEQKRAALLALQQETDEAMLAAGDDYWAKYLAAAEANLENFDELAANMLEGFTGRFGAAFEAMIFDSQSLGDSIKGMAEGMARSVINALGQMAAQWLAYQVVQKLVGKTGQASAATAMSANAYATSIQAGIAAFASTAAIPIVGPAAAPGAMAAAIAATAPMAAAVQGTAMAGMAHDGIDSVPQTGTWLLEKGERVVTSQTSAKLDATLSRLERGGSGAPIVNLIENSEKAGQVEQTTNSDSEQVINIFVADIRGGGKASRALESTYGMRRQGT